MTTTKRARPVIRCANCDAVWAAYADRCVVCGFSAWVRR